MDKSRLKSGTYPFIHIYKKEAFSLFALNTLSNVLIRLGEIKL